MGIGSASKLRSCLGDNSTNKDGSGIMASPGVKTTGHDDTAIVASPGVKTTGAHDESAIMASPGVNTTGHDDTAIVASPGVNTTGHDESAIVASLGVNTTGHGDFAMVASRGANTIPYDDSVMAAPGANTTSHDDSGIMVSIEANTSGHDDFGIMASSGTNTTDHDASTSSGANFISYDVFLSFRGEDTRYAFTDHLYHALERSGILTFRDTDEINRGQELAPEIKRAIKASKASIIVLSENYATSTWCLDELWLILKQRKEYNHFVLPVFHHVDPSDVRNQRKTFDIKAKSSTRWTDDNIKRWKESLALVASLSGLEVSGEETKLLNEIVDTIYNELDYKELSLPANLIGMDTRYEEIMSWLCQSNLQYVAICGMGGSGKTTLAKYIYNLNRNFFENMSFIENIDRRCKGPQDFLDLQKQLLKDILRGRERKVTSAFQGAVEIKEALREKKAFIVLDDIVDPSQLATLFGSGEINPQSKIIITTEKTCNWGRSSSLQGQQYIMKLLNDDESLELINLHAFGSTIGDEDFKDLAVKATKYCEGNPLALEVLGSSLYNSNTVGQWKSELENLKKDIDYRITNVLERSYDSLRYEHEKELFLHIACFFIGMDKDYVEKILEPDYSAVFGIETLTNRCLISVSSDNKLRMHRLLQEMGKNIVHKESRKHPANRSRVWLSKESYKILKNGNGSKTIEGLIFDTEMLKKEEVVFKISKLKTDALQNMDNLKLLQLNSVELSGSYEHFSEDLRWLCWIGFHLDTIPSGLFIGKLVVLDMTYGKLEVFDPPVVLPSLKILNLKDSCLREIGHISRMPNLETLILWNCYNLVYVCETIGDLKCLSLLNMTGCTNLFDRANIEPLAGLKASSSGGEDPKHLFPLPCSLQKLFLNGCESKCTDSLSLSLSAQPFLQYLNLSSNLFEVLPSYGHLKNLLVLDLIFCGSLKWLLCLPSTLAELYVDFCKSLEKVTFQSRRFTLQEFGYSGCCNLYEVEGLFKLVPIAKLEETELGHMKWLTVYQYHSMLLAGDYDLTTDRSQDVQMLYEFDIMSTSLPNIKDSNLRPDYISESSSLSFVVPSCPKNKKIKGLDVTFKYALSGDDWVWFAKVSTTNGVDLMYNPMVFGKPGIGEVGIWLSYWPIGSTLDVGDKVNVSIVVLSGLLEVLECGASLVYSNDKAADETLERNMGCIETLGGDLSRFELRVGAYYLCRCDLFAFMEVGRLTPGWLSVLVGDNIDDTAVRGWRKTGRPRQMSQPFTELKTIGCIIHDPPLVISGKHQGLEKKLSRSISDLSDPSTPHNNVNVSEDLRNDSLLYTHVIAFTFFELETITRSFKSDYILGQGGFGTVYKGYIEENVRVGLKSLFVAVKVLKKEGLQGHREWLTEVNFLGQLRHPNLVKLIGYCCEDDHRLLVYEFMSRGSLENHLFRKTSAPLSWSTRMMIALGAAKGLAFLHSAERPVIYRDFKTSNILLDSDYTAKLSDFGYTKAGPQGYQTHVSAIVMGTYGYAAPEYVVTGHLTARSDVYSFGVVLLELLTGRKSLDMSRPSKEQSLVDWARPKLNDKRKLLQIIDPRLESQYSVRGAQKACSLAYYCLSQNPKARPLMSDVVETLEPLQTSSSSNEVSLLSSSSSSLSPIVGNRGAYQMPHKFVQTVGSGAGCRSNCSPGPPTAACRVR